MAKYNHNESLTENAMRGVDITEPYDFEDEHGWSPDSDYEVKTNLTPEEEAERFKRYMDEIGGDLEKAISEIKELEEN